VSASKHRRALALAAVAGVAGLGVGATAGAGGGANPPADALEPDYGRVERFPADALREVGPHRLPVSGASASRAGRSLALKYYVGTEFRPVAPGGAQLLEVRCPISRQQAMAGGVFSPTPGLVISNSSRTSPEPTFPTHSRAWYEAVTNLTGAELSWKPFLICVQP
jgi:hypothetical protein